MAGMAQWQAIVDSNLEQLNGLAKEFRKELENLKKEKYTIKLNIDEEKLNSVIKNLDKMLSNLGQGTGDFKEFQNLSKQLSSIVTEVQTLSKAFGSINDSGTSELLSSIKNIDQSLSSLSQHIVDVNKDFSNIGKNANDNVSQINEAKKATEGLADATKELANAQKNVENALSKSYQTKNKTEAYNQLKETSVVFKNFYGNEEAMHTKAGIEAAYSYYKAYEEALKKGVARSKLERVTVDVDPTNSFFNSERITNDRIKEFENFKKYGGEATDLSIEISTFEKSLLKFDEAYSKVRANLGEALITPGIIKNIEEYVRYLEIAESRSSDDSGWFTKEDIDSTKDMANMFLDFALEDAIKENEKYITSLKETKQAIEDTLSIKDVFQGDAEKSEMNDIASATEEAIQAKKDFATANEGVQSSVDGSKTKLELESELMQQIAQNAREAANAKKEFAEANKDIKDKSDSSKKDKYKDKSKVSEDDYTSRSDYYASIANQKLIKSGNTILGNSVNTELIDGLVKVNAKIKSVDGTWQTFSAKIDADGNMFEQRFRTITKNVDKLESELANLGRETSPNLSYQETLNKANKIRESLNLDDNFSIKVDSNEFVTITQKLSSVGSVATSVTQTFKSAEDAINNFAVSASNAAEKTSVALKSVTDNKAESQISSMESILAQFEKQQRSLSIKPDDTHSFDQWKSKIGELNAAVDEYKALLGSLKEQDIISDDDITKVTTLENRIKDLIQTMQKTPTAERGYENVSARKVAEQINSLLKENSAMSKQAKAQIRAYYDEVASGTATRPLKEIYNDALKVVQAEREMGRSGKSFFDAFKDKVWYGAAGQLAGMFGIYDIINVAKDGVSVVRELDTSLTEMRKVSDESVASLKRYQSTTFDTADSIGTTAKQIQDSTADWMRLGENINEAAKSAEASNILLNVSEFESIDSATESLVAMSQAYKELDKMQIVDVLNNIGNRYSISTDGLATALQKSASALKTANNDLNEAVSLITAGNAVVQDPNSVGAGLRTIALRLTGTEAAKEELASIGEETDNVITVTSKLRNTIIAATKAASADGKGFDILDANGNYKSTYEILQGLADLYDDIVAKDKELGTNNLNLLLETIAGKNRSNIAASILQNGDLLRSVYQDAQTSDGSAQKELDAYLESIDGKIAQFQNRAQELWSTVIDSNAIKGFIDAGSNLLHILTQIIDVGAGIPILLGSIGGTAFFKNLDRQKVLKIA